MRYLILHQYVVQKKNVDMPVVPVRVSYQVALLLPYHEQPVRRQVLSIYDEYQTLDERIPGTSVPTLWRFQVWA